MGMDWHSSGITTSVIGALKRAELNDLPHVLMAQDITVPYTSGTKEFRPLPVVAPGILRSGASDTFEPLLTTHTVTNRTATSATAITMAFLMSRQCRCGDKGAAALAR